MQDMRTVVFAKENGFNSVIAQLKREAQQIELRKSYEDAVKANWDELRQLGGA